MLLEPRNPVGALTQAALQRHEEECVTFYSACPRDGLNVEFETLLLRIVERRRDLHGALTTRNVDDAQRTMEQLLYLQAQAAAIRQVHGDLPFPPKAAASGPQDRRKERRRTAREQS